MLFKLNDLKSIKAGTITLAFRKWKRPMVRKGTLVKTAVGQIVILDLTEVEPLDIDQKAASEAGYRDRAELLQLLDSKKEGTIYKIQVAYHSPDPRIELRNQSVFSEKEFAEIKKKLDRMDAFSKQGNWTLPILQAIRDNPKLRAKDLAEKTGRTKDWLKPNIRKLKNLGLTISHEQGYTLSPRGEAILKRMMD